MNRQSQFGAIIAATLVLGCTSITVTPLDPASGVTEICIEKNPRVDVPAFLEILRSGFDRYGIATRVFVAEAPSDCQAILTYTALRSWDLSTYMSRAELWIRDDHGKLLAEAEYHLRGKGGFSLTKWESPRRKLRPVFEELLKGYQQ